MKASCSMAIVNMQMNKCQGSDQLTPRGRREPTIFDSSIVRNATIPISWRSRRELPLRVQCNFCRPCISNHNWGRGKSQIGTSFHEIADSIYLISTVQTSYLHLSISGKRRQRCRYQIFTSMLDSVVLSHGQVPVGNDARDADIRYLLRCWIRWCSVTDRYRLETTPEMQISDIYFDAGFGGAQSRTGTGWKRRQRSRYQIFTSMLDSVVLSHGQVPVGNDARDADIRYLLRCWIRWFSVTDRYRLETTPEKQISDIYFDAGFGGSQSRTGTGWKRRQRSRYQIFTSMLDSVVLSHGQVPVGNDARDADIRYLLRCWIRWCSVTDRYRLETTPEKQISDIYFDAGFGGAQSRTGTG